MSKITSIIFEALYYDVKRGRLIVRGREGMCSLNYKLLDTWERVI
jgi:hypothetical protein